jgi:hypothetical protein
VATTVEIGTIRGFVLDSAEQGVLDQDTLGGLAFVDVTDKLKSVSIQRGKNRDLERYSAGSLDVSFNNEDRFFDPVTGTAIDLVPRVPIRVKMDGAEQFFGSVNDWNFAYNVSGKSDANVTATDDFQFLANRPIDASGSSVSQTTGERITAVLDMLTVDWPADRRDIDTGSVTLDAGLFEGQNALEYLQLVEQTEQGQLFIAKNGDLTFRDQEASAPSSSDLVAFADTGSGIPFVATEIDFGSELLANRAVVSSPAGQAIATDDLSILNYGIIERTYDVLNASQAVLDDIAEYIVQRYADPKLRFAAITVNVDSLNSSDRADVLGLEISDVVSVTFTPNQVGAAIERFGQVIRISHSESPGRHDVTFGLNSLEFAPFVLDDAEFGKLDVGRLGF